MTSPAVVLRTTNGCYRWWPNLDVVDFVAKGKRVPTQTWNLDGRTGTDEKAARRKAERIERGRRAA